ncbi:hypothetical protein B0T24DRAFT_586027 [Lasiosphaeria ovina]|uniref:DUF6589 domain-containing protein n=1 Tax=Lasiosphaeria ovina TaxID=92902 RepID=A0AAE0JTT0_9PEZI|nr:hypothetical protein B0T24DRAFT_586027 [Lasiosphaeria ovina]
MLVGPFVNKWVENGTRAQQLADALLDPRVQEALKAKGVTVKEADDEQLSTSMQIRKEMKILVNEPPFGDFEPEIHSQEAVPTTVAELCNASWVEERLTQTWPTLVTKAPSMVAFFSQVLQNQSNAVLNNTVDENNSAQICLLSSLLMRGYARNTSPFIRQVLGLYMLANGTPRRVIDTLAHLGIISSYTVLNRLLNKMEKQAKDNIKAAAHDPNGIIVYDNFNFMNRIRELAGGRQHHFVNLTTTCLVTCPELNGPLQQSSLDLTQRFTRQMVIQHLLPRQPSVDAASKWLLKYAFMQVFAKGSAPEMPTVKRVTYKESPFLQIGAIFENEGTIDGVYKLHEELWKRRLDFKEYDERLTLVYGDCKTTTFIRRIKQSQLEASELWEQKKWLLPVPALFHIELNYIEMLFRMFWDTGSNKSLSTAVISADVQFFQRGKHITKKDIKYHQVLPLLMHGYTARVLAFVIHHLVEEGKLLDKDLTVDGIQGVMTTNAAELDSVFDAIWKSVFSFEGWTGRYNDLEGPVDLEFRSHCRLMQCVEVLLILHEVVRHGDYGLLRDIIPMLPVLFWGGKSSNYGPEMLYFAWLLHPVVSTPGVRDAILKGGLIRCTTVGSQFKAIDLMLEHINATYALDIKNNKNSTHDIHSTFSRLALNGNYLATIRKAVERVFGSHQKGTHTAGDPTVDVISYACKLYKDGMTKRNKSPSPDAYDAPDLYDRGQKVILEKLDDFNDVVPEPKDAADQRLIPGVGEGGTEDNDIDWIGEGQRLFTVDEDDFWADGHGDLGVDL